MDDGIVRPHPPGTAELNNLKSKFRALPQFEVVDWVGALRS
jgi:hypothetical protein